jgi:hypothetical protein
MADKTPQRSFFSSQDVVSPDVNLYYAKVIKDIDSFRSRFNGITTNLSQTMSLKDLDSVFVNNEMNSVSPQESRCHAFYRMIGFPVPSADGIRLYSPGFDPDLNRDKVRIQKNLDIANSILDQLKNIMTERELYPSSQASMFQNKDVNSSALAISSIYTRSFDKQFKAGLDPLQPDSQTFEVPGRISVASNFSTSVSYSTKSTHILKPFIVDPRIELTVTPATNRICAPFLLDKSKTQLSQSTYLKRPYIERVMRVRFNTVNVLGQSNQGIVNQYVKDLLAFVKTNSEVTNPLLVEVTTNALNSLHKSEIIVFSKFIKIIEALVVELVQAIIEIDKIRGHINWKPTPNAGGPEFGCTLNKADRADQNNRTIETNIASLEMQKILQETDFDIGFSSPDLGGFSFSNVDDIIFGSLKNISQFYDKQLNTLEKRRGELGNRANDLLRKIEIITGEFSGLGLLDVIAIQAALWTISPKALMGLIDDAAIERMQKDNKLKSELTLPNERLDVKTSLAEFEKKLSEIYVLTESFVQDSLTFGLLNKQ